MSSCFLGYGIHNNRSTYTGGRLIILQRYLQTLLLPSLLLLYGFSFQESTTLAAISEKDECIELEADTILTYQFKTSLSVKFDLHSHISDTEILSLDSSYGTTGRGPKTILIKRPGVYCLNWKNRYKKDITLDYQIQFEDP